VPYDSRILLFLSDIDVPMAHIAARDEYATFFESRLMPNVVFKNAIIL